MADYKDVQNRRYVYPRTDLETSFVNGVAEFPADKEVYFNIDVISAVKAQYTSDAAHIHEYDYWSLVVNKPEWWPSEEPTPPTPQDPELSWSEYEFTATIGEYNIFPTLVNPHSVSPITYSNFGDDSIATIDSSTGEVTLVGEGSCYIGARFDGNDEYEASVVKYNLIVEAAKQDPELQWSETEYTATIGGSNVFPTLTNPYSVSPITYRSTNTDVATVDEYGQITLVAAGECFIWAEFAGDSTYNESMAKLILTVENAPLQKVHLETIKNNSVSSTRIYNITQEEFIDNGWDPNAYGGDTIAILDDSGVSGFNPNCFYKTENPQTFTQLTQAGSETITIEETTYNAVKFVLPATIGDGDDLIFTDSTEALYDVVINKSGNTLFVGGNWWKVVEDNTDPQNTVWRTKLPENIDVGIESRNYESYSFSPSVTLNSGTAVGKYFTMPSSNLTITFTGYDYPDYKIYIPNDYTEYVMVNGGWAEKHEEQGQYYYYADVGNYVRLGTRGGELTLSVSPSLTDQTIDQGYLVGDMPASDVTVTIVS